MGFVIFFLLIAALVCFLLATFGALTERVSVGWLGLAIATVAAILVSWPGA